MITKKSKAYETDITERLAAVGAEGLMPNAVRNLILLGCRADADIDYRDTKIKKLEQALDQPVYDRIKRMERIINIICDNTEAYENKQLGTREENKLSVIYNMCKAEMEKGDEKIFKEDE